MNTELYRDLDPGRGHPWVQVTEIEEDIYLGGIPEPHDDPEGCQELNSTHAPHSIIEMYKIETILSFTDKEVWWNIDPNVYTLHFVLEDSPDTDMKQCFPRIISRIKQARSDKKKIFIHCVAGISRSATALCAYYIYAGIPGISHPSVSDVVKFLQSKRPFVHPNPGFLKQLVEYHEEVNKDECVVM
jgi:protein-tyrosine phosphatase